MISNQAAMLRERHGDSAVNKAKERQAELATLAKNASKSERERMLQAVKDYDAVIALLKKGQVEDPAKRTPEQAAQEYKELGTRAPAFKAWFGDWEDDPANASKAVNLETGEPQDTYSIPSAISKTMQNGRPVVVYHGSAQGGFDEFRKDKIASSNLYGPGFYFTEDKGIAEEYTKKGGK